MGLYTNKGLYNKYDKNRKERDKLDYYATKPGETKNILETLGIRFAGCTVLEPCIGGGHMATDISAYIKENNDKAKLIGTDIRDRGFESPNWNLTYNMDFLDDNYFIEQADIIIMNPPFATIEPFCIRALEIAKEKLLMFARLQFLEGSGRYENILKDNPPTAVYVYVDRIQCWKDGKEPEGSSAQAYAWFIWDKAKKGQPTELHWIRRK